MRHTEQSPTITEKRRRESLYGTRFTVFSELPYFDAISMTIIDPMHNLFLGTSKKMIEIWKEKNYLNKNNVIKIQKEVDNFVCSNDVGKLPSKIEDFNFNSFTADELKNWTLIFSNFCLMEILPKKDFECWKIFVEASLLLCNQALPVADIDKINSLLFKFCKSFESIYGKNRVTPNMHMHCHLADCIVDFGPVYSFWLFSFERYNGILGSQPSNNRGIESQLMRRFDSNLDALCLPYPDVLSEQFLPIMTKFFPEKDSRGSIQHGSDMSIERILLTSKNTNVKLVDWSSSINVVEKRKLVVHHLSESEIRHLTVMYNHIYPEQNVYVHRACWKTSEVVVDNVCFGSDTSRTLRSSHIMAFWCGKDGKVCDLMDDTPRPGKILYFIKHVASINGRFKTHFLSRIDWYLPTNNELKNKYGVPVMLFRDSLFELGHSAAFMPVQRIFSKFVYTKTTINSANYIVVIPRYRHLNI